MVSNIFTNTQMSHKHPVFEGQISSQKKLKNHANSFSDAIRRCPYPQKTNLLLHGLQRLYYNRVFGGKYYNSVFGGEDSYSDMDMSDDDV